MIPILYEKDETAFISNGLGRLRDCISAKVTEERNGIYELDFEYPITGFHYKDIQLGRIVGVEHDDTSDIQPFDIVSYSRPINGVVTFHCQHISYRQSKLTTSGTNINSLAAAFSMLGNSSPSNPFTYWTDKTSTGFMASADGVPRSVRSFLGGVEGSILDAYGGEYEWDGFVVRLHSARGEERDVTIRYGVNLTDYNEEVDYSSSYTACIPFWTGDDGNGGTLVVKAPMVDSGAISHDGRVSCIPLDLTDKFEDQPTTAQLTSMAQSMMSSEQSYLPAQTIQVSFIRLQDTNEYSQYASLMTCRLCDSINVEFPRYGMSGKFKIVKTVYDVLLERFEEMELGTLSTTLSEALGITQDGAERTGGIHIVETGTSGIWTWRKWSDGTAECWGLDSRSRAMTNSFDNAYYADITAISFPSGLFTSAPTVTASRANIGNTTGLVTVSIGVDATKVYGYAYSATSLTTTVAISFHAIGRWK